MKEDQGKTKENTDRAALCAAATSAGWRSWRIGCKAPVRLDRFPRKASLVYCLVALNWRSELSIGQFRIVRSQGYGEAVSNIDNQRRIKGQQLKGKIISEIFTLFQPGLSPSKQRVF